MEKYGVDPDELGQWGMKTTRYTLIHRPLQSQKSKECNCQIPFIGQNNYLNSVEAMALLLFNEEETEE